MDSPVPLTTITPCSAPLDLHGHLDTAAPMEIPPQPPDQLGQDTSAPMDTQPPLPEQHGQDMGAPAMETRAPPPVMPVPLPQGRFAPRKRYTVNQIFREFTFRRSALIRALTKDEEALFNMCNPDMDSMYLYGRTDGSWEVRQPELYVPTGQPEPTLGINLVRDILKRHKWLQQIAKHCDSWLIGLSFFIGANLDATERGRLFTMMNGLPTVHDVVIASDTYRRLLRQDKKISRVVVEENDEIEDEDEADSDQNFCASCGDRHHANGFWIGCDVCNRWYHGKCVKVTEEQAEQIDRYECPECFSERIGHDYEVDPFLTHLFKRY